MTTEEKQEIVSDVISAIRTNSAQIIDLTEVLTIPDGANIELSGGKRIAAATLLTLLQTAIMEDAVSPAIASEAAARDAEDDALAALITALQTAVDGLGSSKFNKSDVVQVTGTSTTQVMSQDAVTTQLGTINTKLGNIAVALGSSNASKVILLFTDQAGTTASIEIGVATSSAAGVMSADDKTALDKAVTDIASLQDSEITGASLETDDDSATIVLATGDNNGREVTIPKAGTIPDGETDPVAGVMSVGQAQDLEAVVLHVFPLEVAVSSSNAGTYEKGSTVVPDITLNITRRGEGVARSVTLDTVLHIGATTDNTIKLDYQQVTENTTFNIAVSHRGSTVNVAQQQYRFVNYVYGDVLSAAPGAASIASLLRAATTLKQLSTSTTYNGTLQAGKFFLFGVPGNVTLVCRHSETGAIISGCTTGTVQVGRQNDAVTTDLYSYIVVPSSDVAWNFKITNS